MITSPARILLVTLITSDEAAEVPLLTIRRGALLVTVVRDAELDPIIGLVERLALTLIITLRIVPRVR